MTGDPYQELPPAKRRRLIYGAAGRALLTAIVLVVVYYVVPDRSWNGRTALRILAGLLVFAGITAWQVKTISGSRYPGLKAAQALGLIFPLYLLVSTQRPQKIPDNVLSQADNLVLMRLNSLADAAFAQAAFSFVPPSLIERSVIFHQGEGLIAGKISPQPALLRFGARITQEGGADVPATWATPAD